MPVNLLSMNAKLMVQYVQFVADHLMASLGQPAKDLQCCKTPLNRWSSFHSKEKPTNLRSSLVNMPQGSTRIPDTPKDIFALDFHLLDNYVLHCLILPIVCDP